MYNNLKMLLILTALEILIKKANAWTRSINMQWHLIDNEIFLAFTVTFCMANWCWNGQSADNDGECDDEMTAMLSSALIKRPIKWSQSHSQPVLFV